MKQVKYAVDYTIISVLFVVLLLSGFTRLNAAEVKIMPKNPCRQISLFSSEGKITLYAPDKYVVGDKVSGKLTVEPAGEPGKKQIKNSKKLGQYSLEVAGTGVELRNGFVTWTVPDEKEFTVALVNSKGKKIDSIRIPVDYRAGELKDPDFLCPRIVQDGQPFHIQGPHDGDFGNTCVKMGDEELQKLAESPRVVVVERPSRRTGLTEITITERNIVKTFKARNIAIALSAENLHLKRGQTTGLAVIIKGLEELEERLPLYVTNHSRETVDLEGEGTIWIEPAAVDAETGTFVFKSTISARQSGSYRITGTVIDQFEYAPPIDSPVQVDEGKETEQDVDEEKYEIDETLWDMEERLSDMYKKFRIRLWLNNEEFREWIKKVEKTDTSKKKKTKISEGIN